MYISQEQIAWAAGIIDGEGTISFIVLKPNVKNRQKTSRIQPFMSVEISRKEVVFLLKKWFGGFVSKRRRKNNWAEVWLWKVSSRQALKCAQQLLPHLRIKKAQAEIIIEYYQNGTSPGERNFLGSMIMNKRLSLLETIRSLNTKGGAQ